MPSIMSPSSRWWSKVGEDGGLELLDKHVDPVADWSGVVQTGAADWQRAQQLTGIPTGKHLSLLEIGCGAGRMTGVLASQYRDVMALDVSEWYLGCAQRHCTATNVTFRAIASDDLEAAADRRYDVAFSYEVFHYVSPDVLEGYMSAVQRLLHPGGHFVFEINTLPMNWLTRASLLVRRVLHACGKRSWRGWPTSPHFIRKTYSPRAIATQLQRAGLTVSQIINPGCRETWFVATKPSPES